MTGVFANYHCNYCQAGIRDYRVKCAECLDFDLCVQCFAGGAEMGPHKKRHSYQIIDCGNTPVFDSGGSGCWKAFEELQLLEAIDQYGFGNWEDVASALPNRTADEVYEHYATYYTGESSIGRHTWAQYLPSEPGGSPKTPPTVQVQDHTTFPRAPFPALQQLLSPSLDAPVPNAPTDLTPAEQLELGYMPLRDDFEKEYDNEAEKVISTLSVNSDDEELDTAIKLAHIDMYRRRLSERLRRKRVARDFGLVPAFFTTKPPKKTQYTSSGRKLSRETRELQERVKPLCQFLTAAEYDRVFDNIERETELKSRIKELSRYRRNGLTRFNECAEYDKARKSREKRKDIARRKADGTKIMASATTGNATAFPPEVTASSPQLYATEVTAPQPQPPPHLFATEMLSSQMGVSEQLEAKVPMMTTTMTSSSVMTRRQQQLTAIGLQRRKSENGGDVDLVRVRESGDAFTPQLQQRDDDRLLTARERRLGSHLGLGAAHLLALKAALLKEHRLRPSKNAATAFHGPPMMVSHLRRNGWLRRAVTRHQQQTSAD